MASEKQFCVSYSTLWSQLLPQGDVFTRRVNLEARRFAMPVSSAEQSKSRIAHSFAAELGFMLFERCTASAVRLEEVPEHEIQVISARAVQYIQRFTSADVKQQLDYAVG
jgi:hypothetical protein